MRAEHLNDIKRRWSPEFDGSSAHSLARADITELLEEVERLNAVILAEVKAKAVYRGEIERLTRAVADEQDGCVDAVIGYTHNQEPIEVVVVLRDAVRRIRARGVAR